MPPAGIDPARLTADQLAELTLALDQRAAHLVELSARTRSAEVRRACKWRTFIVHELQSMLERR